jgi:hypothetical protein
MDMKTILLAATAAFVMIASAQAGGIADLRKAEDEVKAKEATKEYTYECAVTKSNPMPNDPSYKVTIVLDKDGIRRVIHTTASGKTYVRNQQYPDAKTGALRENEDWNTSPLIWIGTFNKSPDISMVGKIGTVDNGKKMIYLESLYKTIKGKKVVQAFIESTCHEVQA